MEFRPLPDRDAMQIKTSAELLFQLPKIIKIHLNVLYYDERWRWTNKDTSKRTTGRRLTTAVIAHVTSVILYIFLSISNHIENHFC